ncbi:hypothetical protein HDF10_004298 [Edaphobacter lichenicola]|uniref:Uncharacterized protein n=1 Tax=Tunturiibacter lichenicola TaxID=2051959 RepID=A0A7W8JC77_9BACT|nr:hypothetical protein [Edaphobacter lichenicola]
MRTDGLTGLLSSILSTNHQPLMGCVFFPANIGYRNIACVWALRLARNRAWAVTLQIVSQFERRGPNQLRI